MLRPYSFAPMNFDIAFFNEPPSQSVAKRLDAKDAKNRNRGLYKSFRTAIYFNREMVYPTSKLLLLLQLIFG